MHRVLRILFLGIVMPCFGFSQIATAIRKANFGVDADLRANFFDGAGSAGNDDWFRLASDLGPGVGIIDSTGAAGIISRYLSNPATRMQPFFRGMRYPQFSVVNNRLLIDAIFIRDHHGDDSTVFASGSNKNGMSPANWSTPVSQGIPDKNDILDMYMHVRRDGPNSTDSLWFFGGLSIDNTTGNRYFDFEMYQTDIVYNRSTLSFNGIGPDAGHTSWTFDGDIIFTAEYGSSFLSALEARIWVHQSSLSITPAAFNWGGDFDGGSPGATYGYANILPKTAGTFYTGLQCGNNTWAGPFQVVLQNNNLAVNYSQKQFMEFSVNLSKLGLDPLVTVNDPCAMPFRRILVKSRASTSFTAELKDFVGPFSFFRAPQVDLATNFPNLCTPGISNIWITNALPTSLYTWHTTNGNILGDTTGSSIQVNQPGTYIVSQELMDSCGSTYARDTIVISAGTGCGILNKHIRNFMAVKANQGNLLSWQFDYYLQNDLITIERSIDGIHFTALMSRQAISTNQYTYYDDLNGDAPPLLYYRIRLTTTGGKIIYSTVERVLSGKYADVKLGPVPTQNHLNIVLPQQNKSTVQVMIYNTNGVVQWVKAFSPVNHLVQFEVPNNWPNGSYIVKIKQGDVVTVRRFLLSR
jgi:Secretion system C-terminal sorting domain